MVAIQTGSSNNFGAKREKQREFNVGSAKCKSGIVKNVGVAVIPRNRSSRSIESIDEAESRVESNVHLRVDRVGSIDAIDFRTERWSCRMTRSFLTVLS